MQQVNPSPPTSLQEFQSRCGWKSFFANLEWQLRNLCDSRINHTLKSWPSFGVAEFPHASPAEKKRFRALATRVISLTHRVRNENLKQQRKVPFALEVVIWFKNCTISQALPWPQHSRGKTIKTTETHP